MKRFFCLFLLVVLVLLPLSSCSKENEAHNLEIRFLNVGQGDATLIRTSEGDVLIDTGPESAQDALLARLRSLDVTELELMIVTHADEDHMGGADGILRTLSVKSVWTNGMREEHDTYAAFEDALTQSRAAHRAVCAGEKYTLGELTLFVLAPFSAEDAAEGNEGSIVLRMTAGNATALFTGDAESKTEQALLTRYGRTVLDVDLYKVGHHGSSTSTGQALLDAMSPQYAVICCGRENSFGHPHGEVIERLESSGVQVFRTDLHGEVCFSLGENGFELLTALKTEQDLKRRTQQWQQL